MLACCAPLLAAAAAVRQPQPCELPSLAAAPALHAPLALAAPVLAAPPRWRFRESFDREPIAEAWVYEMEDPARLQIVPHPARLGAGSAQFTLQPGDKHAGGNRSELKLYWDDGLGATTWCSWSFLVPTDYADTASPPGHQIMGQWHDRPPAGVAWADYEHHPPLIAIKYVLRDGVSTMVITYGLQGINKQIVATQVIQKGEWIDLRFHIRWSMGNDGYIEAWKNGQPITAFNGLDHRVFGPNMYNETPAYLKLGLYRADGFETTNSVYFDEVRVGRRFADVSPQ